MTLLHRTTPQWLHSSQWRGAEQPLRRSDLVALEVAHYFYPQCMLTAAAHKFASVMGGTIFTINI